MDLYLPKNGDLRKWSSFEIDLRPLKFSLKNLKPLIFCPKIWDLKKHSGRVFPINNVHPLSIHKIWKAVNTSHAQLMMYIFLSFITSYFQPANSAMETSIRILATGMVLLFIAVCHLAQCDHLDFFVKKIGSINNFSEIRLGRPKSLC